MDHHKDCYGTMFHDSLHFSINDKMQGKVFGFELDSAGIGRSERIVQAAIPEWDDCVACPDFEHCCKFCMAKLGLEAAISNK